MRRSCHCWNGCVPPPVTAMLSLSALFTSASRICVSWLNTSALLRHTSVETSIMPLVISGTTEPGSSSFLIRRSMSSA